jgi:hypothetical protein
MWLQFCGLTDEGCAAEILAGTAWLLNGVNQRESAAVLREDLRGQMTIVDRDFLPQPIADSG